MDPKPTAEPAVAQMSTIGPMPSYGHVRWSELRALVAEATMGVRDEKYVVRAPLGFGHQEVSMNWNSLNRIVSAALATPASAGEPSEVWVIRAPDGRTWSGETAFRAASLASRETRTPEQAANLLAGLQALQERADAEMAAEHEHLNCPACGGSGHIDDVRALPAVPPAAVGGETDTTLAHSVQRHSLHAAAQPTFKEKT